MDNKHAMPICYACKIFSGLALVTNRLRRSGCPGHLRLWLAFGLFFQVVAARSASVVLAWNPSPSGGVQGYHVYFGTISGFYTGMVDVGSSTTMTVSSLTGGQVYYFAITAYDASGLESGFSNELSYTPTEVSVPLPATLQLSRATAGGMVLTVTGPAGRTYDLLASADLRSWAVIRVVSLSSGGRFDFTDPDAAKFPARFYRARETQPSVQLRLAPARQMVVSVSGQNGVTYDVQASSDLAQWTKIGAVTLTASGGADFVDVNAPNYPARFYRTRQN